MEKEKIIEYLKETSYNTNWAVLKGMLGDGDWDDLKEYVRKNLGSMNVGVVGSVLDGGSGGGDNKIYLIPLQEVEISYTPYDSDEGTWGQITALARKVDNFDSIAESIVIGDEITVTINNEDVIIYNIASADTINHIYHNVNYYINFGKTMESELYIVFSDSLDYPGQIITLSISVKHQIR